MRLQKIPTAKLILKKEEERWKCTFTSFKPYHKWQEPKQCGTEKGQTCKSREPNRNPEGNPSISLSVGERTVLGPPDVHAQNDEGRPQPHTIFKNQLKMIKTSVKELKLQNP